MLTYIFFGLVGAFVGWLTPEPQWAKDLAEKIITWATSKFHIT